MYICICRGISEDKVRSLKQSGHSPKEILKKLGVGQDCGICLIDAIKAISPEIRPYEDKKD